MFSPTSISSEPLVYDFETEDNAQKWKGILVTALHKVQNQVHPSLSTKDDAIDYIETLILRLLGMLCSCQPHSVSDVEDRVQKTFPHPIDKWAVGDAQNALEKGKKKAPLVLPVDKIHPLLKDVLGYKVDMQVSLYIVAVLEYIAADILKLAGNYVKNIKHQEITCQDIKVAMCADKVLMDMFFQDDDVNLTVEEEPVRQGSITYEEIMKDLVLEETQYLRDLNMIIKVFRAPFAHLFPKSKDLEVIFSNILDIHELTVNFLSSLEDTLEMTEENVVPLIGGCFEEMAEGAEFECYETYTGDIMKPHLRDRLNTLLKRPDVMAQFQSSGKSFIEAGKYVLPKLLLGPVYHFLHYFDGIKALQSASPDVDDQESLIQAEGLLDQLNFEVRRKCGSALSKRKPGETSLRFQGQMGRQAALSKMNELQKSIDGWEGKAIALSCNEFIMEGVLLKLAGKRLTERQVFLFDGLIILCKANTRRSSVTGPVGEFRLKEKFQMRKVDVIDKEDTDDIKNAFELQIRDHPSVILVAKTAEDKNTWMASLISLHTRSMLERMLDSKLNEEEKQIPLRLPSAEEYSFAEEDSEENIVFEESTSETPLIKGGTLIKLVEKLTNNKYADPKFVKTFLTTYRSFCKPQELLDFLIQRFEIPDPFANEAYQLPVLPDVDVTFIREQKKRFMKEFSKPVQFRVLNVIRHWVNQHFYDFERDSNLLARLTMFLEKLKAKAMKKWAESILKIIQRKVESQEEEHEPVFEKLPPVIEWHIARTPDEYDLMTLHPIEIARQVTLLEFDLYRAIKPSELVGSVWIKKDKNQTSPNLLKMIHHSTMFTFWLEKCIIESENHEERVHVLSRTLEILMVFQELNNFNGMLEVVSALNSAPVHRLEHTFAEIPSKLFRTFDEAKELNSDHYKKYIEKLRSINPPCVPFVGRYLTNILFTEEGNPDYLPNRPPGLINFSKRRKVAEITGEIQQYQNQPYCLTRDDSIINFFENLNPLGDMSEKEFNDYIYNKSLEIEPRNSKAPVKFPKKYHYSLKTPGIKPMSHRAHGTLRSVGSALLDTTSRSFSFQRLQDDTISDINSDLTSLMSSSQCGSPTPMTPPATATSHGSDSDSSVFAQVLIGQGAGEKNAESNPIGPLLPPPLPPRRNRDAPPPPPRAVNDPERPPPLPPRRERDRDFDPIPRSHSVSSPHQNDSFFATPLRFSSVPEVFGSSSYFNGTDDLVEGQVPRLPPKTYKRPEARKPSS